MSAPGPSSDTAVTVSHERAREVRLALRNALKLGLSLVCTWTVTLLIRFQLPRFLGPLEFGAFNFADSFAASFFAFLDFGVDVYIQKEVSVRPKHASDFIGGLLLLRGVAAALLCAAMLIVLRITNRSGEVQFAAALFAAGYLITSMNTTFGALLQASTRVGR